jgi:hypothetical protein
MPQEEEDESKQNKGKQRKNPGNPEIPKNVKMLAGKFNELGETA